MKIEKVIWEMISSIVLLFYGCILLSSSWLQIENLRVFLILFFALHGLLKFMRYFEPVKDNFALFSGISDFSFALLNLLFDFVSNTKWLAFMFLAFTCVFAFIKLKKADFFHDRKDKFWLVEISNLLFFLILSIFLTLNLAYPEDVLCLFFGFYVFFLGVSEFYECFLYSFMKGTLK